MYGRKIYAYVSYNLNVHNHMAEDLTEGVFLKVLENLGSYRVTGVPFSAWLYRIAHNHVIDYLRTLPYVDKEAIGAVGVSHGGEMILKAAAATIFAAGVSIEGASHEFLSVDTGPDAPRKAGELQYQDIDIARKNADKAKAMERIRRIETPILHIGREKDHLQGIFKLAHEWMREAGRDSTWASFDHPEHGYPFIYRQTDGSYRPDPVQQRAFDLFMEFFDRRLKRAQ